MNAVSNLMCHLLVPDSLAYLARNGLPPECVPGRHRKYYEFAIDYWQDSERQLAPTVEVLMAEFRDEYRDDVLSVIDDLEAGLEVSIGFTVADLKARWVRSEASGAIRETIVGLNDPELPTSKLAEAFATHVAGLAKMAFALTESDEGYDLTDALMAYDERSRNKDGLGGLSFGLPLIDQYTRGIHDGELAVLAAPTKTGKSFFAIWVAQAEWKAGKRVMLYTLENSAEMTYDRLISTALGVSARDFSRGSLSEGDYNAVKEWHTEHRAELKERLMIIHPSARQRTPEAMVLHAQVEEVDSLIIDQLTFIEPSTRKIPRHLQIAEIMRDLKSMISTGADRLPLLLVHQINREGVREARKTGKVRSEHMAESAEVERTADWVFNLLSPDSDASVERTIEFQTSASRRADLQNFNLMWNFDLGQIKERRAHSTAQVADLMTALINRTREKEAS